MTEKYYSISPYAFCAGNPVNLVDPEGNKLYFANGVSEQFKRQFAATIKFMNSKGTAGDIAKIHDSDLVYYIAESGKPGGNRFEVKNRNNRTIYWDPNHILETGEGIQISPMTILAHEAAHAQRYDEAQRNKKAKAEYMTKAKRESDPDYGTIEEREVIEAERRTARKHGEIRPDQVTRRTHREQKGVWITTGGAEPSEISYSVFKNNEVF